MNRRAAQVASTLHRAVQEVINRGFSDPRISGLISVTDVRVDDDLTTAVISVAVRPADREPLTMHGLRAAANYIRRQAGELVALRRMPTLQFKIDERVKREAEVLAAISQAVADLERGRQESSTPDQPEADASGEQGASE